MKDLAIITVLFDYPCSYQAIFENKLFNDFDKNDYFKLCYDTNDYGVKTESLYYKFTRFRITEMIKFVEDNILGKYKYCMLLDATDIGYVGGINNFKDILKTYNTEMLFGAETNLWPGTDFSNLYENKNRGKYNFLNAGTLLANVELYYNLMKKVNNQGRFGLCDQGNWQIEYLTGTQIEIDYKNLLVLNTYNAKDDFTIENKEVNFKINKPMFVHDNGGYNDETVKLLEYFIK